MTVLNEQEAALNEGLAEMPADVQTMRNEWLAITAQVNMLNVYRNELRDKIAERMKDDGVQGYIFEGKVKARTTNVTSTGVDSKKLKTEMPSIWEKFMKVTSSVRVSITA